MRPKITKRSVDALRLSKDELAKRKTKFIWDFEVPGFGFRLTPNGARSYVFQYKRGGATRRLTIGRHGAPWTPESARKEAGRLRGEVASGKDPAAAVAEEKTAPTVKEFAERYLDEHARPKKKASSLRNDEAMLKRIVVPALGRRRVREVARSEVVRLHNSLRDTPIQANRVLALLSKMFSLAEQWGLRTENSNPCRLVGKFKERRLERYLSAAELAKLGQVLNQAERRGIPSREKGRGRKPLKPAKVSKFATAAIRMLLFTGRRLSEVLNLRWDDVDEERGIIRLRDSKTGAKSFPLPAPALAVLSALPRIEGNPYVFVGRSTDPKHFVGLPHVWGRIRVKAGLENVRVHDLRHAFASAGASGGEALPIIGALLGHSSANMTARYAHLSDDPVRAAANRISKGLEAALKGEKGKVVKLKRRAWR